MAIVKCQQHDRPTRPNVAVEKLIMDLPVMDEEVSRRFVVFGNCNCTDQFSVLQSLYQRSLEVEPRSSQPSKIKKLMMQGSNA